LPNPSTQHFQEKPPPTTILAGNDHGRTDVKDTIEATTNPVWRKWGKMEIQPRKYKQKKDHLKPLKDNGHTLRRCMLRRG